MRILQLHANHIQYSPVKREVSSAEECEKKEYKFEELVVLFTSVEDEDNDGVAEKAIDETQSFLKKINVKRLLIYPYAHLSNNLAKPAKALKILKLMEKKAVEKGLTAYRAPFGWCKKFTLSIKGHPLAEQFRIIQPQKEEEPISEALEAEKKLKSSWHILHPSGELSPVDKFDFSDHEKLRKLADYEMSKARAVQQVPPHVTLMKKLEIADYEPGSDPGNMRWYPKGTLMKTLLEQYVTKKILEYGAMEVETPVMYDFQHPSLASYLNRFPARQYILKSEDKDLFLRFSACFGQFLIAHDTQMSYRHLPLKMYELTKYSFRREKSGELVGLRRLRAFTMPDCHAFCVNLKQVKKEFLTRFNLCAEVLEEGLELGRDDYELAIRFTRDFYMKNKKFISSIVKKFGKPALVEIWEDQFFYFILKWEFNFIDNLNKASALSTDQLDVENSRRYDVTFIDKQGEKKYPLILHCSPSGAIERCIYAILEKAYENQKEGKPPTIPLWLSPTQIRIVPVSEKFVDHAEKIASKLLKSRIRVDVDDHPSTLRKKIRTAETEWINYIIVLGSREVDGNYISVRDRKTSEVRKLKLRELINEIRESVEGKPFKQSSLPKSLLKRPTFSN